ncbi:MAG: EamA family transporter [Oligoflexales bacterium]
MTTTTFFLVLFSAVVHATWNFMLKGSRSHKVSVIWLMQLLSGFFMLPICFLGFGPPDIAPEGWGWVGVTSCIHAGYVVLLGYAYERGNMSVVYPVARGVGVVGTALFAAVLALETIAAGGVVGVTLVALGILLLGLRTITASDIKTLVIAIGVGLTIVCFSLVDKIGVTFVKPIYYVSFMNVFSSILLIPYMYAHLKEPTKFVWINERRKCFIIGMTALMTYLIIVYAYKQAPASYVVALRETSIVSGVFLGVVVLKEKITPKQIVGVVMICLGAIVIRLS